MPSFEEEGELETSTGHSIRAVASVEGRTGSYLNNQADILGLAKDGWSGRGTHPAFRSCDSSKDWGRKNDARKEHGKAARQSAKRAGHCRI